MCQKQGCRCPSDAYGGPHNSPAKWRYRRAKHRAKMKLLEAKASGDTDAVAAAQQRYDAFFPPRPITERTDTSPADQPQDPAS